MKKFEQPKMKISTFITDDVVTSSGEPAPRSIVEQGTDILTDKHSVNINRIFSLEL